MRFSALPGAARAHSTTHRYRTSGGERSPGPPAHAPIGDARERPLHGRARAGNIACIMRDIRVLPAETEAEREACYRLAYEVFCEEMGTMRDVADHARRIACDDLIRPARLLRAMCGDELVGSVGILLGTDGGFPAELAEAFRVAHFEQVVPVTRMAASVRFLVRRDYRGSAVPLKLIVEAARLQLAHGVKLSFCDCQPHLLGLYTRLGFRPYAPAFDQAGWGLMVPLLFVLVDREHMEQGHRLLLPHFPVGVADPALAARVRALLPEEPPVVSAGAVDDASWSEVYQLLSATGATVGAFEGLSRKELDDFLAESQILTCQRGRQIIGEGQGTRTVYVVLEGAVEVRKQGRVVTTLREGRIFGEFALLLQLKRTADVVAASDHVRLVALSERTLMRLIESRNAAAAKFLLNLARLLALTVVAQS